MSNMTDPKWRKERPVFSGVMMYFPDALREVAHCSYMGNEQHHPGQPLHWDRSKSTDEADACVRHLMESGTVDTDGVRHSAKAAWRALALLQKEIETERALMTSTNHEWNNPKPVAKEAFSQGIKQLVGHIQGRAYVAVPGQPPPIPCNGCKGFTSFKDGTCDLSCSQRAKSSYTDSGLHELAHNKFATRLDFSHEDIEGDPNYWGV